MYQIKVMYELISLRKLSILKSQTNFSPLLKVRKKASGLITSKSHLNLQLS